MKGKGQSVKEELHPHFPSGEWEGFYIYGSGPGAVKDEMRQVLSFKKGTLNGSGIDPVGPFTWKGKYDTEECRVQMVKSYMSHQVYYEGHADENGIWGIWKMDFTQGGFHIWPKGRGAANAKKKAVKKKKALSK